VTTNFFADFKMRVPTRIFAAVAAALLLAVPGAQAQEARAEGRIGMPPNAWRASRQARGLTSRS
jgi:hypothetical protein